MTLSNAQQDAWEQAYWSVKSVPVRLRSRLVAGWARRRLAGTTKVHLGCGPHVLPGWANLDLDGPPGTVRVDLAHRLPFADRSVELVFSEHFIEHVTRERGVKILRECVRILRPGGVLRISTPDLRVLVEEYLAGRTGEWAADGWAPRSPCALLNEGLRLWGHRFVWDEPELVGVLGQAGFSRIIRVGWRESRHPELRGLECRPFHGDLILEATAGQPGR